MRIRTARHLPAAGGLAVLLLTGAAFSVEEPAPKADPAMPAVAEKDPAKPGPRFVRKAKTDAKKDAVDADEAPKIEGRNIPGPEAAPKKRSEIDEELLDKLGGAEEADDEDPLLRAGRRMREVEERLAKQTAAADTVEMQRRIITDLETLLKPRQSKKPKDDKDEKEKKQREKTSGKPQKEEQQQSLQQQIVQQRGEQPSRDSR
ncbi:MAG: hypothetical protein ACRDD1_22000, partial [Planctomycetia bacterium]